MAAAIDAKTAISAFFRNEDAGLTYLTQESSFSPACTVVDVRPSTGAAYKDGSSE